MLAHFLYMMTLYRCFINYISKRLNHTVIIISTMIVNYIEDKHFMNSTFEKKSVVYSSMCALQ